MIGLGGTSRALAGWLNEGQAWSKSHEPSSQDLKTQRSRPQAQSGHRQTTSGIDQEETTFEDEEGGSTVEGDVMNGTEGDGSINPRHRGRTNK
ncbi:hypothetical protein ACI3KW_08230 [Devosia sp. ZW T5_3]|uniref:hypothetical protein n=1 Tax=Devosia sp. ZW T5_3 TaxID=3378085 RepID=UPI003854E69D